MLVKQSSVKHLRVVFIIAAAPASVSISEEEIRYGRLTCSFNLQLETLDWTESLSQSVHIRGDLT